MARFRARGVPSSIVLVLTTVLAASACSPAPVSTTSPAPDGSAAANATLEPFVSATPLGTRTLAAANGADAATQLATAIVDAASLDAAYIATADAIARAGIRIETTTHVFVEPVSPAAGTSMWPRQVLVAALEAQARRHVYRISAGDAGTILAAMGWAVPGAPGDPGESWLAVLRAWLADAKASPDDPTSFAPLFAAEMIRLGDGVDLATAPAGAVRFGLLELLVLTAGFERGDAATATVELAVARPRTHLQLGGAAPEGPCDATLERYGIPPGTTIVPGQPPAWMQQQAVGVLGLSSAAAKTVMKAAKWFSKIWRAAAFYFYSFVRVENTDKRIHKVNEDEPDAYAAFTAKAGVDPDAFKAWVRDNGGPNGVREMNDDIRCTEALGLPSLTDVGDVADDAENWIVEWTKVEGFNEFAEQAETCGTGGTRCNRFDRHQGALGMKLRRSGGSVAEATFWVKIAPEKRDDHGPGATEHEGPVTMRAAVDSSRMPSISPANLTSPAGLIGPGLETIAGLIQSTFKPSSQTTLMVTYHAPGQLVTESKVDPVSWYGERCHPDDPEWLVRGVTKGGGYEEQWLYNATIDLKTLQGTYKYEAIGLPSGGILTKNGSGRASISMKGDSVILTLGAISVTSTITIAGTTQRVTLPVPEVSFTFKPATETHCPS